MQIINSFKLAFRGLLINKARSILTLLGIIIGIAAVITITSLAAGLQVQAQKQIDAFGTNLVWVFPQMSTNESRSQQARQGFYTPQLFTEREVRSMLAGQRSQVTGTSSVQQDSNVTYDRESLSVTVVGVDENYAEVYNSEVESGRLFSPNEISGARRVCILGFQTARDLFGDDDPVGQFIQINNNRLEVIGVEKEVGGGLGENPDEQVMVPLSVAQTRLFGMGDKIFIVTLKVDNVDDVPVVKEDITRAINRLRGIRDADDENYMVISQTEALENFGQFVDILTMVFGGVAAVSLLVGGIGIMNIMLVNVTERTREIGLRKAVGARQVDILFQFLIEAVVLCLIGGLVGMVFGYLGASGLSAVIRNAAPEASWDPVINVTSVVIAVVFSSLIGLIFGVYPAANAARKDPIAALRYE
ncbi:MAG TPA: ABC transporter permease [bacterium]|jgi:putative ABC transport system permease protein